MGPDVSGLAQDDVVIQATEDAELFVTTARSEAVLANGRPYGNRAGPTAIHT